MELKRFICSSILTFIIILYYLYYNHVITKESVLSFILLEFIGTLVLWLIIYTYYKKNVKKE